MIVVLKVNFPNAFLDLTNIYLHNKDFMGRGGGFFFIKWLIYIFNKDFINFEY